MTKTSLVRICAMTLLLSVFLGTAAFALLPLTGNGITSAFATQNTNKSGATKSTKKPPTKVDCSNADDAALAAEIRERLSKLALLKDEKGINVDVKARVATLTGTVQGKKHRLTAATEAKKVACIKKVVNWVCIAKCPDTDPYCCHGVCQNTACDSKDKSTKPK